MGITSPQDKNSIVEQVDAVVHQYLKRYGTLEGMKRDVFVDPSYYQYWTGAVKAPFDGQVRPPEIDFFLNDVHDGFMYVQNLLNGLVTPSSPTAASVSKIDDVVPPAQSVTTPPMKSFTDMNIDDQISVRASTVVQLLSPFVSSSIMSGLELNPERVVQLLPGLLDGRPAAESEEFNAAVYYLTQLMAYLGVQSIESTLHVVSFDDNGEPTRYNIEQSKLPLGELYSKWR
jgi:hypothetical protein